MALKYSKAKWRPLESSQGQPPMLAHDIVCEHTMVGYLTSTDGYFRSGGWSGTESHFGTGGKWGPDLGGRMDGAVFQWQDLMYSADANYHGSRHVISIENADNAASPIAPFTDAQIDANVELLDTLCDPAFHRHCPITWRCRHEGIPRQLIPDTKPGRRGIAFHRQGVPRSRYSTGPDWLVPGGVKWSTSPGKVCPGDARILQTKAIIIPRLRGEGEGELSAAEVKALQDYFDGRLERMMQTLMQGKHNTFANTSEMPWLGEARTITLNEVATSLVYYAKSDDPAKADADGIGRNSIFAISADHSAATHLSADLWKWIQDLGVMAGRPVSAVSMRHKALLDLINKVG